MQHHCSIMHQTWSLMILMLSSDLTTDTCSACSVGVWRWMLSHHVPSLSPESKAESCRCCPDFHQSSGAWSVTPADYGRSYSKREDNEGTKGPKSLLRCFQGCSTHEISTGMIEGFERCSMLTRSHGKNKSALWCIEIWRSHTSGRCGCVKS